MVRRHHGVKFIFQGTRDSYKLVTNSGRSFCDSYVQISVTNTGLIVGKDSKDPNEPAEQISTISEYATENSDYDDRHIRRFSNVDLDNFDTPEVKIKCEPRSGEELLLESFYLLK